MRLGPALLLASRSLGLARGRRKTEPHHPNYLRGAVAGVALSLLPLVVVLVVADGMIQGITARYLETSTYHFQAFPLLRLPSSRLAEEAGQLADAGGPIVGAWAELQGPAVAVAKGKSAGALIRAIEPSLLTDPGFRSFLQPSGGELGLGANEVILGEPLARSLGLEPGDLVSLVTARRGRSESELLPRASPFKVRAVVSAGYRELDALWAFIPLSAGARILAPESSRSFIGIKVSDPFSDIESQKILLEESLSRRGGAGGELGWSVLSWAEAERNLWKSFSTTKALLLVIMTLAVAVAAINVSSALVMLVLERRRDIAILKSAGASAAELGLVFLLAGLATGGLGTILGIGLGALIAWRINGLIALMEIAINAGSRLASLLAGRPSPALLRILDPAYYLEKIPVRLDVGELGLVAGLSLLLCLLASALPARRAARLPPLEIMRKT